MGSIIVHKTADLISLVKPSGDPQSCSCTKGNNNCDKLKEQ